jgi:hypothetical protein
MGLSIDRERFDPVDYRRFGRRLDECLVTLGRLLGRPGFGVDPTTVGAELELFLVDGQGRALPRNQAVRAETADPRVVLEIDRFNLELNLTPAPLAGRPFAALGSELDQALGLVRRAAAWHEGRVVMVGILPTLRVGDNRLAALSDAARYRALNNGIRRLRHEPLRIRIDGADPLELMADDVGLEGANTSFQVHLRVDPDGFASHFNAAQLATGPALAVAGNSPTFLGHRLWEETRVALFKQAVDDRDAAGGERAAARAGPARARRRTTPGAAGRPRGAGLGGAAAASGHAVAVEPGHLRPGRRRAPADRAAGPAGRADGGRHAGECHLPARADPGPGSGRRRLGSSCGVPAGPSQLLPGRPARPRGRTGLAAGAGGAGADGAGGQAGAAAAAGGPPGLQDAGVMVEEADSLLAVVQARAASGQTGAAWQRRALAALEPRHGRERGLAAMLERYLRLQRTGEPVHTWPVPSAERPTKGEP